MNFSYKDVEQYLVNYEIEGNKIYCEFQAPNGEIFESTANIKASKTVMNAVQEQVARAAKRQAKRQAGRFIRSMMGGSQVGRIGSRVARSALSNADMGRKEKTYTAADKEEAITKAFARVARNFGMDKRGERVERRERTGRRERPERGNRRERGSSRRREEPASPYEEQLADFPISNAFEQEILARLLIEVAGSDGSISTDEKEFLNEVIPSRFGTITDLQRKGPISRIESEELNPGIRESIYMLAWSMAVADLEVDHSESRKIESYGEIFGISEHRRAELAKIAKTQCLEQSLNPDISRTELFQMSDSLELDRDDAERCLINFKKKMM